MSILVAIMIPNPFTRLVTTWVTIAVVVLHGVTVWAMMSVDSSRPLEPVIKPKAIQIELVKGASPSTKSSTETPSIEPQPNPSPPKTVTPKQQPDEPIQDSEPAKSPETVAVSEPIKPLKTKVEKKPLSDKTPLTKTSSKEKEPKTDVTSSVQSLTTVESRKIIRLSNDSSETDDDLSAMIRAVTAQFNREQAIQKRSAKNQAGRKQAEREQWRVQAANEAIANMLALAADQAAQQNSDQADLDNQTDKNEAVLFATDDGRWIEGSEPNTGVPALVWRNVSTGLGDVFIVMLELHVNKEGYVTEVQVLESSGSPIIDAIATTQVRAGQLNPLKDNGIVVDAIIPMSLVYERS